MISAEIAYAVDGKASASCVPRPSGSWASDDHRISIAFEFSYSGREIIWLCCVVLLISGVTIAGTEQ
jgi:hypothetical protein